MSLSEVAASLGVTRSSAYRLLYTLEHLGFVDYEADTKSYALGPEVLQSRLRLSGRTRSCRSRDAASGCGCAIALAGPRTSASCTGEKSFIWRASATRRSIASTVHVGTRLPARVTTMGARIAVGSDRPRSPRSLSRRAAGWRMASPRSAQAARGGPDQWGRRAKFGPRAGRGQRCSAGARHDAAGWSPRSIFPLSPDFHQRDGIERAAARRRCSRLPKPFLATWDARLQTCGSSSTGGRLRIGRSFGP